jgi:hypothetical protein
MPFLVTREWVSIRFASRDRGTHHASRDLGIC